MNDEPTIIKSLEEHLKEYGHTTVGQDIAAAILVIRELHAVNANAHSSYMINGNPNLPFETNIELRASVTEEILNKAVAEMARQDITFAHCDKAWQERAMRAVLEAVLK